MGLGDADRHACASGDSGARRSGQHRMDRSLKGVRKQYRRVSGMQLPDGGRTPVRGGMQGGRNIHARRQRRRRQHTRQSGPPVPVGSPATAARSSSGRRARPLRTPCRLRPPRRLPDASRSATTIPPILSCRTGSPPASRAPRSPHSSVSSCPGPISSTMRPMYQTRLP